MGLFDFFKEKKESKVKHTTNKILLAMPMFNNGESYQITKVIEHLKTDWSIAVSNLDGDDQTATFTVNGETIALAAMPTQIPWGDIQGTAQYTYSWPTAEQDLRTHNVHAILTIMTSQKSDLDRFKILTMVISSILATSNAIGVYQGSQSLLISKEQYLFSANTLKKGKIPVNLWVYFGLRRTQAGNCVYTYGLSAFGKPEMEIINSKNDLEALHNFLLNICAYVIGNNVTFKSGESLGYTAEQKIRITASKGFFVEGQTLKLEM